MNRDSNRNKKMSEQELNSYRFLSGEEPSEEMLAYIMKEAAEDAVSRKRAADERAQAEMIRRREALRVEYSERISRLMDER